MSSLVSELCNMCLTLSKILKNLMIWSISYHINVTEFGLWSCALCDTILKSWHLLTNIRKICTSRPGYSDDSSRSVKFVVFSLTGLAWQWIFISCIPWSAVIKLQNGRVNTTESWGKIPQILKLNHRRSKHCSQFLKHSNDSLWTKSSGILVFKAMSSTYCIARTSDA